MLARLAGTIFVERERKVGTILTCQAMAEALQKDVLVVLFPEGTSSGGQGVLPFRSALLGVAAYGRCAVTVAHLQYELETGDAAEDVCFWKDMTLVPHLWHLLTRPVVDTRVRFKPVAFRVDRKELALLLRHEIQELGRPLRICYAGEEKNEVRSPLGKISPQNRCSYR
jgi:1-acyl-sn-glycerol-3-phosphate acyltransferase